MLQNPRKSGCNCTRKKTLRIISRLPFALALLLLSPSLPLAAGVQSFDGSWQTTVSCDAARDALGYSYQFVSTVKGGVLHGEYGAIGQPSSLQLDGTVGPDGMAKLYAKGLTGSKEYVPGRDTPKGTPYG
jgi:hypothetical protein